MLEQLELLREQHGTLSLVVWGAFIVGIAFGIVAEISRYCARAALAEWAPGSERRQAAGNGYVRTKQYIGAVAIAFAGTQALSLSQDIDLSQSIYWSVPINPLALIVGGILFGVGMVLSGGCVSRLLVLAASGNGRSLVTLLITGIAAYATLRGILSYPRIWLETAWATGVTPAAIYSGGIGYMAVAGLLAAGLLTAVVLVIRRSGVRGLLSGALIGACVVAAWVVTGLVGADEFEPIPLASLSFVAPVGESIQYLMIFTGDTIRFSVALFGGVIAGAFASALIGGRLRYTGFTSERSLLRYIAGGFLMGFGGVTALGCTVGQGLSGLSTASLSSVIAVIAISAGGYFAMAVQARRQAAKPGEPRLQPAE